MVVHTEEEEKKSGGPLGICIGEPAESAEANFHFPLMIDLVPDSFQHEASVLYLR